MAKKEDNRPFFIKSDNQYYPIRLNEINWVYAHGNYSTIHTAVTPAELTIRMSIAKLKDFLSPEIFQQTHRNYIINLSKIERYDPAGTVLIGNQEIPISRRYKKIIEERLNFLGSK